MRFLPPALRRHVEGLPVYFIGSCLALALDTAVLLLALRCGMSLVAAASTGFLSGMSISYFVSVRYAFARRSLRDRRIEFLSFVLIGLLGLGLTQLLLALLTSQLHLPVLAAKAVTAALVFFFNYSLRKHLLFTRSAAVTRS
ncbi:MAG: GtrA family protein [Roseateles sp.]|jgi:putative flippase GtrA|nr:GtrA family protein [Burkholderiaceae bacterium]|mmetsp:Transcript_37521/g.87506  ORF Transcript_37521/g.87506 Transcript_37521/m.87506 type:complete len:142 (+) Transcript_37521:275-700(+)